MSKDNMNLKTRFRKYKVQAKSITDFLGRYYKPDRFRGRGAEYASALIKSHQAHLEKYGYDIISRHDSVTGRMVVYYGPPNKGIKSTAQPRLFPVGRDA